MANRAADLSSSLRGTGSLHSLLGRDVTRRRKPKPSNPDAGVGDQAAAVATAAEEAGPSKSGGSTKEPAGAEERPAASGSGAARGGRRSAPPPPPAHPPRPGSPLLAGHVRCPLCSCQLPHDDAKVNAHLGESALALAARQSLLAQVAQCPSARNDPSSFTCLAPYIALHHILLQTSACRRALCVRAPSSLPSFSLLCATRRHAHQPCSSSRSRSPRPPGAATLRARRRLRRAQRLPLATS